MKNKPNPDYIDAPYECVGELNGVSFVISEKCPNTALCIWIKMPDRIPMIFDVLDGKWVETSVKQSWFKQLPFPPPTVPIYRGFDSAGYYHESVYPLRFQVTRE